MRSFVIVALGGAVGAGGRWAVGEVLSDAGAGFPWHTLAVNLVGCALIGVAARRLVRSSDAWLGFVTGGLGGLTTFSAFAHETRVLLDDGNVLSAAVYVVASVVGGVMTTELVRGRDEPA